LFFGVRRAAGGGHHGDALGESVSDGEQMVARCLFGTVTVAGSNCFDDRAVFVVRSG
jgi:hypothetical protein